jgi:membrane-bound lytic murein transglycosylase D
MLRGRKIAAAVFAAILIPACSSLVSPSAYADSGQSQANIRSDSETAAQLPTVATVVPEAATPAAKPAFILPQPRPVPPFPILLNKLVQHYVAQYLDHPHLLEVSFQRSQPYMSQMMRVMRAAGVPDDLVFLAFAESDFSHRGKGPWQFSVATARRFGLHVNHWVDERRDPILSTRAAAEYLASLHDSAGEDWRLAVVGWNGGDLAIDRFWELRGTNFNRFMDLLPQATRSLLGRFMAVAFIAHNSPAYGIGDINYDAPPRYKEVPVRGGLRLTAVARKFHTSLGRVRTLNPAILHDRVPPYARNYRIRVPLMRSAYSARADSYSLPGGTL